MAAERRDEADDERALAARAAWLYHAGGLTQAAVARALGVNDVKAHRLLARAARDGTVRVLVEGSIGGCIELEDGLRARFGLATCRVVPELGEAGLPLRAIGQAGAAFLRGVLEGARNAVVGVGHGRSLAACVQYLPRLTAPGLRLVSLLGGLPRLRTANPYEMIHLFAERTGADAWLVPVPFFANAAAERTVLAAQRGVAEAFALAREAQLCLVGIGEVSDGAFLLLSDAVSAADAQALRAGGAVGEMLGRYFDADGQLVRTELHARVVAAPLETLSGLTAIAGGVAKQAAILAVLRSGLLDGLITDDTTARFLLEAGPETTKGEQTWTRHKTRRRDLPQEGLAGAS